MRIRHKIAFFFLTAIAILLSLFLYPYFADSAVLNPTGLISLKEQDLIYIATPLMLIIVIPVLIMTFAICIRYRSSNKKAEYEPEWSHDTLAECIWWGFPCLIVLLLSIVTWVSSYHLDPFRPLRSGTKPIPIQVVALQWKWLFIYPEQKIAAVNFFQFPESTPLNFEITADAPMNSFWIPQMGGQIYAMPGMRTKLHLMAYEPGDYRGSSANLSGVGFAGMTFIAKSGSQEAFDKWVQSIKESENKLGPEEYSKLALPSENNHVEVFNLTDADLFDQIIMKYMMPSEHSEDSTKETG